jgi:hypothetical protein
VKGCVDWPLMVPVFFEFAMRNGVVVCGGKEWANMLWDEVRGRISVGSGGLVSGDADKLGLQRGPVLYKTVATGVR